MCVEALVVVANVANAVAIGVGLVKIPSAAGRHRQFKVGEGAIVVEKPNVRTPSTALVIDFHQ